MDARQSRSDTITCGLVENYDARRPCGPKNRLCRRAPTKAAAATMSDSSSDDDVPLSQLQAPAKPAAKPKAKKDTAAQGSIKSFFGRG